MITEEHIQKFLEQAHRVGDAALTIAVVATSLGASETRLLSQVQVHGFLASRRRRYLSAW